MYTDKKPNKYKKDINTIIPEYFEEFSHQDFAGDYID